MVLWLAGPTVTYSYKLLKTHSIYIQSSFCLIGGDGKEGVVEKIETWEKTSVRGGAQVKWMSNKEIYHYRIGGEGSVDLVYTRVKETGGKYYVEHIPLCGKMYTFILIDQAYMMYTGI